MCLLFICIYMCILIQVYIYTWLSFRHTKPTLLDCPEQLGVGQGDGAG